MTYAFEIEFGSPLYDEIVALRYELLRQPLGLEFYEEEMAIEYQDIHYGLYRLQDDVLIGSVLIRIEDKEDSRAHIKQVVVSPEFQGKGMGRKIMKAAEEKVKDLGINHIFLNARDNVTKFYEKMGYQVEGDKFLEVGIVHQKMMKFIS